MLDKGPSIAERLKYVEDAVTLFANGLVFDGWETVAVTRSLNSAAASFDLGVVDPWTEEGTPWRLNPGDSIFLHVGKKSLIKGHIDEVAPSITAASRSLSVNGRSLTGDIVDCSAEGANEFNSLPLDTIAKKLCAPFKINPIFRAPAGAAFPKFNIRLGETVFEILDRLARERALLIYPDFDGNLIFDRAGTKRAPSEIRQGQNVLSASGPRNFSNRFSKYTVYGQAPGTKGSEEDARGAKGTASDAGVSRYRPLVIVSENSLTTSGAKDRAKYEAAVRAAKASVLSVDLYGWAMENGELWDINQIVAVDIPYLGARDDYLIDEVVYRKSGQGTIATLKLIRPDAYLFSSDIPPEKKLGGKKKATSRFAELGVL
jgi:prophage tail gpP-like protein